MELLQEGEGALSKGTSEKRNEYDFALWKAGKPGEPTWDSPWGEGRPGWHIECSAMGLSVFGNGNMDMHAGGIDLRFPHHDNELAQNEACFCHHQSVNYFLHAGHLHIDGLKMSKSLKNFTTIRAGLETSTANQIRMLFLLNAWDKSMNFSNDQFEQAVALEKRFSDYFQNIKVYLRGQKAGTPKKWSANTLELKLWQEYTQIMKNVRVHLQNNLNTNAAINELLELVGKVNTYLSQVKDSAQGYLLLTISLSKTAPPTLYLSVISGPNRLIKTLSQFKSKCTPEASCYGKAGCGMGAVRMSQKTANEWGYLSVIRSVICVLRKYSCCPFHLRWCAPCRTNSSVWWATTPSDLGLTVATR